MGSVFLTNLATVVGKYEWYDVSSAMYIRWSEVRFLMGTLNFFFVPHSRQDEKKIFLHEDDCRKVVPKTFSP